MSAPLLLGAASFFAFALSDFFGVLRPRRGAPAFFALGGVLLAASTLWLVLRRGTGALFGRLWPLRWLSLALAAAGLALLVHPLFFALPAGGSGVAPPPDGKLPLVDTGVFALCRHPGMLWLGLGYLGLWGALGGAGLGLAFVLFTALDLAYVFWQDRRVFPHSIAGYERYRARVPFLLPSARSLRACLRAGTRDG